MFTAKNPLEGIAVGTTEFVTLKADDGTPLYGKLHKPTTLDPNKKYPVLIYVYGGPHAQQVKNEWLADTYLWLHSFVENEQLKYRSEMLFGVLGDWSPSPCYPPEFSKSYKELRYLYHRVPMGTCFGGPPRHAMP